MAGKPSTKLFYKIGEVCRLTDVKPHILRYWESEFPALAPRKSRGGQRVYEPRDLEMVKRIKRMLYEEGYTIAGARKHLSAKGGAGVNTETSNKKTPSHASAVKDDSVADALGRFKKEIQELLDIIGR
jgi:DNA-binding transcriptional MerR regulator